MFAYRITNLTNGRCYIGITSQKLAARWARHIRDARKRGSRLGRAILRDGPAAFTVEHIASARTFADLLALERQLIAQEGTFSTPKGYNATEGGEGVKGAVRSPETRAKISAAHTGRVRSAEHSANLAAANRRLAADPVFGAKISAAKLGVKLKLSDETRALLSLQRTGRTHTEDTKRRMAEAKRGKRHTPEACARISAGLRRHAAGKASATQELP